MRLSPGVSEDSPCRCTLNLQRLIPHNGEPSSRKSSREVGGRGREVGGRWPPPGFLPLNWGGTEQNRTTPCIVLKAKANDMRKNVALHGPRSDFVRQRLLEVSSKNEEEFLKDLTEKSSMLLSPGFDPGNSFSDHGSLSGHGLEFVAGAGRVAISKPSAIEDPSCRELDARSVYRGSKSSLTRCGSLEGSVPARMSSEVQNYKIRC
ncbi:hypothetical protein TNCV_2617621 [Trichonephila clavipes]|nr:hypothetical protein TNCV_2617621 [Trichonephila clavipes]